MSHAVSFTKMVGAGNDFIIVDARRRVPIDLTRTWPAVSRVWCDRHTGIGADGLLVIESSKRAEARIRVFNPDGSEAEMCGNGARCVARYVATSGRRQTPRRRMVTIETRAGVLSATVRGHRVAMRMTEPVDLQLGVSVPVDGHPVEFGCVNTGVPHVVVPVKAVDDVDVVGLGRALRRHPHFAPQGTNVNFVQLTPARPNQLRIRTYERGVEEETLACGTGVAAAAVVHAAQQMLEAGYGRPRPQRVELQTRSGETLSVTLTVIPNGRVPRVTDVVLEGSAERVYDGTAEWPRRKAG